MANPLRRKIGDAEVFCIGYGAMGLSGTYNKDFATLPDEERFQVCLDHPRGWHSINMLCFAGPRCSLGGWMHLLGHCRHLL